MASVPFGRENSVRVRSLPILFLMLKDFFIRMALLGAALLGAAGCSSSREQELRTAVESTPKLYGVEAVCQVYVESGDAEESLMKYFGNRAIVIPVKATVKAGVDLSGITDMTVKGRTVHLTLPPPEIEIESTQIEWNSIVSDVSGFRDEFTDAEISALASQGRAKIEESVTHLDLAERAEQQAEQTISAIAESLGMTVVFNRRPKFTEKEIIGLIKK